MTATVAPRSVRDRLTAVKAKREEREEAWRVEQALRVEERCAKLPAGEAIRCECRLRMIETAAAAEKDRTLVHARDCEQQSGSADYQHEVRMSEAEALEDAA